MRTTTRSCIRLVALIAGLSMVSPGVALAQRYRWTRSRPVRSVVVVRGYHGPSIRPYYPYYRTYWYPGFYGYPGPLFYPAFGFYQRGYYPGRYDASGSLRIQVTPRQAEVYVDGYYAGLVDDYDGYLQRLHVASGGHEITLRLEGYRTYRQTVYLRPGSTQKIRHTLEKLGPGETTEPPPQPTPPPQPPERTRDRGQLPPPMRGGQRPDADRFGTLALRIQPADADVLIDGERWQGAGAGDRLVVQLPEGRHRVEIQKDGYERFSTEIQVRRGETTPLNVSLLRLGGQTASAAKTIGESRRTMGVRPAAGRGAAAR